MTALAERLLDEAMQLPPDERRKLALRLLKAAAEPSRKAPSSPPEDALRAEDDPVLGELWANDVDAVYDEL